MTDSYYICMWLCESAALCDFIKAVLFYIEWGLRPHDQINTTQINTHYLKALAHGIIHGWQSIYATVNKNLHDCASTPFGVQVAYHFITLLGTLFFALWIKKKIACISACNPFWTHGKFISSTEFLLFLKELIYDLKACYMWIFLYR